MKSRSVSRQLEQQRSKMNHPDKIFGRLGNSLFQRLYVYGQMRRGVIPDIYVQDPAYFDDYRGEIKQMFKGEGKIDKVAIHVRRGSNPINKDEPKYCDNPFYVDLMGTSYYQRAIAMFPNDKFLVFSDDIDWCMKQPIFERMSFSVGGSELDDLNDMASCKAVIIANSSFSYMGAYLSEGKVIAPKQWYTDGNETRTVLPKEWIRI